MVFPSLQEVPILPLLIAVALAPMYEGIAYRSVGYRGLRTRSPVLVAAGLSAAVFAAAHWWSGFALEIVAMSFFFGLGTAWLLHWTKSLWPCVAAHFPYNLLVIVIGVIEAEVVGWGVSLT